MSLSAIVDSGVCARLVVTLAHGLWQGAAIAAVAFAVVWFFRRSSATRRYAVLVAALLLMAACPAVTFVLVDVPNDRAAPSISESQVPVSAARQQVAHQPAGGGLPPGAAPQGSGRPPSGGESPVAAPHHLATHSPPGVLPAPSRAAALRAAAPWWRRFAPHLTLGYLAGVLVMVLRLVVGIGSGRRLRKASEPVQDSDLLALVTRQARRIALKSAPAVAWCGEVAAPTVVGILRATILLPLGLATGLSTGQVEALLTHELAHIRRYDHLLNILQRLIEAVFFFHPAVWLVSRQIRIEREHCCDDTVVAAGSEPFAYADSLVRLAERSLAARGRRRISAAALGAADRPSRLRCRVLRLVGGPSDRHVRLSRAWPLGLALAAIVAVLGVVVSCAGQRGAAFADAEFVSVKVVRWQFAGGPDKDETVVVKDAEKIARLASFFPGLGRGRPPLWPAGWDSSVNVTLTRKDGTTLQIASDYERWSTSRKGDWPVKGDLKTFTDTLFPIPATQRAEDKSLPGSDISIVEAMTGDFLFAAVCRADERSTAISFSHEEGVLTAIQTFRVLAVLGGHAEAGQDIQIAYTWFDVPGRREREIAEGETVIWITHRQPVWISGAKAVAHTPKHRAAVTAALKRLPPDHAAARPGPEQADVRLIYEGHYWELFAKSPMILAGKVLSIDWPDVPIGERQNGTVTVQCTRAIRGVMQDERLALSIYRGPKSGFFQRAEVKPGGTLLFFVGQGEGRLVRALAPLPKGTEPIVDEAAQAARIDDLPPKEQFEALLTLLRQPLAAGSLLGFYAIEKMTVSGADALAAVEALNAFYINRATAPEMQRHALNWLDFLHNWPGREGQETAITALKSRLFVEDAVMLQWSADRDALVGYVTRLPRDLPPNAAVGRPIETAAALRHIAERLAEYAAYTAKQAANPPPEVWPYLKDYHEQLEHQRLDYEEKRLRCLALAAVIAKNAGPARNPLPPATRPGTTAWGEAGGGLRCRAWPAAERFLVGERGAFDVEVESVASEPMFWSIGMAWVQVPGVTTPGANYDGAEIRDPTPGRGAKTLTYREAQAAGLVGEMFPAPAPDTALSGHYRLAPNGRVSFRVVLLKAFERPGKTVVDWMLSDMRNTSGMRTDAEGRPVRQMTFPRLTLDVIAGDRGAPATRPETVEALFGQLAGDNIEASLAASRELGKVADGHIVQRLGKIVADDKAAYMHRTLAVHALGHVRGHTAQVMPILVDAADTSRIDIKAVYASLSEQAIHDKAALPFVMHAVCRKGGMGTPWNCEHIDWEAIGPAAVPFLRDAIKKPGCRDGITFALCELGQASEPAIDELVVSLGASNPSYTRRTAARALAKIGPAAKKATPTLVELLKEKDSSIAREATLALGAVEPRSPQAIDALTAALGRREAEVRWAAASALGQAGPAAISALNALTAQLKDESPYVRRFSAEAIGRLGPEAREAVDAVSGLLTDKNIDVRCAAALATWRLTGDAAPALDALAGDLRSKDGWDRHRAAETLGEIGAPAAPAMPALIEVLSAVPSGFDHSLGQGREAAANALGRIGPAAKAAIPALVKAQSDPEDRVRKAAARAIVMIAPRATRPTAGWSKTDGGLRYRWVPHEDPVVAGTMPKVAVEVENAGTEVIVWGCHPGVSWGIAVVKDAPPTDYSLAGFTAEMRDRTRGATVAEAGVDWVGHKADETLPGHYCIPPGGRVVLTADLPERLDKPGRYQVESILYRSPPAGITFAPMRCPPLELTVVAEPATRPAGPRAGAEHVRRFQQFALDQPDWEGHLSDRLKVRVEADTWDDLVARVKPAFTWGRFEHKPPPDCGFPNMLWIEDRPDTTPIFRVARAYTWKPTGENTRWVLVDLTDGPGDQLTREQTADRPMSATLPLSAERPHGDHPLSYAVIAASHPRGGTVYEVGWARASFAGNGWSETLARIYVWRDAARRWRLIGEGPEDWRGKAAGYQCYATTCEAKVLWQDEPAKPVIDFVRTHWTTEVGEEPMGLPTRAIRWDAALHAEDEPLPAGLRWSKWRYLVVEKNTTLDRIIDDLAVWDAHWQPWEKTPSADLQRKRTSIRQEWRERLVRLNPWLSLPDAGPIPAGRSVYIEEITAPPVVTDVEVQRQKAWRECEPFALQLAWARTDQEREHIAAEMRPRLPEWYRGLDVEPPTGPDWLAVVGYDLMPEEQFQRVRGDAAKVLADLGRSLPANANRRQVMTALASVITEVSQGSGASSDAAADRETSIRVQALRRWVLMRAIGPDAVTAEEARRALEKVLLIRARFRSGDLSESAVLPPNTRHVSTPKEQYRETFVALYRPQTDPLPDEWVDQLRGIMRMGFTLTDSVLLTAEGLREERARLLRQENPAGIREQAPTFWRAFQEQHVEEVNRLLASSGAPLDRMGTEGADQRLTVKDLDGPLSVYADANAALLLVGPVTLPGVPPRARVFAVRLACHQGQWRRTGGAGHDFFDRLRLLEEFLLEHPDATLVTGALPPWYNSGAALPSATQQGNRVSIVVDGQAAEIEVERYDAPILVRPVALQECRRATPLEAVISMQSHALRGQGAEAFEKYAQHFAHPESFSRAVRNQMSVDEWFTQVRKHQADMRILGQIRCGESVLVVVWLPAMPVVRSTHYVNAFNMIQRDGIWYADEDNKLRNPVRRYLHETGYAVVLHVPPPATRPGVLGVQTRLEFPPYTGLAPRAFDGGDIQAVEGTRVTMDITTDTPTDKVLLEMDEPKLPYRVDPLAPDTPGTKRFRAQFTVSGTTGYVIRLIDAAGRATDAAMPWSITCAPDAAPTVRIVKPASPAVLAADGAIDLAVTARDDFAVTGLTLVAKQPQAGEVRFTLGRKEPAFSGAGTYKVTPADLGLKPGESAAVTVEAKDNRAPFANTGVSEPFIVIVPGTPAGGDWGEPVEGVQVCLRAERKAWTADTVPVLIADVQNVGPRDLQLPYCYFQAEVEVDGVWYRWTGPSNVQIADHGPYPRAHRDVAIHLSAGYTAVDNIHRSLALAPGRHVIRLAFSAKPTEGAGVRALSRPVEIDILADAPVTRPATYGEILAARPMPKLVDLAQRSLPDRKDTDALESFWDILKLRDYGDSQAVPVLVEILASNAGHGRIHGYAAAQALFRIGGSDATAALDKHLLQLNEYNELLAGLYVFHWDMPEPSRSRFTERYLLRDIGQGVGVTLNAKPVEKDRMEFSLTVKNGSDKPLEVLTPCVHRMYLRAADGSFCTRRETGIDEYWMRATWTNLKPGETTTETVASVIEWGDEARKSDPRLPAQRQVVVRLGVWEYVVDKPGPHEAIFVYEQVPMTREAKEQFGLENPWCGRAVSKPVPVRLVAPGQPAPPATRPAEGEVAPTPATATILCITPKWMLWQTHELIEATASHRAQGFVIRFFRQRRGQPRAMPAWQTQDTNVRWKATVLDDGALLLHARNWLIWVRPDGSSRYERAELDGASIDVLTLHPDGIVVRNHPLKDEPVLGWFAPIRHGALAVDDKVLLTDKDGFRFAKAPIHYKIARHGDEFAWSDDAGLHIVNIASGARRGFSFAPSPIQAFDGQSALSSNTSLDLQSGTTRGLDEHFAFAAARNGIGYAVQGVEQAISAYGHPKNLRLVAVDLESGRQRVLAEWPNAEVCYIADRGPMGQAFDGRVKWDYPPALAVAEAEGLTLWDGTAWRQFKWLTRFDPPGSSPPTGPDSAPATRPAGEAAALPPEVQKWIDALTARKPGEGVEACRRLGMMGEKAAAAVPAVAALLADGHLHRHWIDPQGVFEDIPVGAEAAQALTRMGPAGVEALRTALYGGNATARENAAFALWRVRPAGVDILVAALKDADAERRPLAARALACARELEVVQPLLEAFTDEDARVREAAVAALSGLWQGKPLEPLLAALKDREPAVRTAAARVLGAAGRGAQAAVVPLVATLQDRNDTAACAAARALGEIQDPRAVDALATVLKRREAQRVSAAAQALVCIRDTRGIDAVAQMLESRDRPRRGAAAEAFESYCPAPAVPGLAALLKDEEPWVRKAAATALSISEDPRAVEPLISALTDVSLHVRWRAAQGLGRLKDRRAVEPLTACLTDDWWAVRESAAEALGAIGDRRAVPALIAALKREYRDPPGTRGREWGGADRRMKAHTATALKAITGQDFGEDAAKWEAWWTAQTTTRPTASNAPDAARPFTVPLKDGRSVVITPQAGKFGALVSLDKFREKVTKAIQRDTDIDPDTIVEDVVFDAFHEEVLVRDQDGRVRSEGGRIDLLIGDYATVQYLQDGQPVAPPPRPAEYTPWGAALDGVRTRLVLERDGQLRLELRNETKEAVKYAPPIIALAGTLNVTGADGSRVGLAPGPGGEVFAIGPQEIASGATRTVSETSFWRFDVPAGKYRLQLPQTNAERSLRRAVTRQVLPASNVLEVEVVNAEGRLRLRILNPRPPALRRDGGGG